MSQPQELGAESNKSVDSTMVDEAKHGNYTVEGEEDEYEEEDEELSEDDTEDEEEDEPIEGSDFIDDEAALSARKEGLEMYNRNDIEAAIQIQSSVAAYFSKRYGELDPRCALFYLDYGMSLLAQLQALPAIDAALAGNTGKYEEEFEVCYNTLELARRGFDEQLNGIDESDKELFSQTTLRLAEAHDSIALLFVEKDDDESAIREFHHALALRREVLEPKHRLVVSTEFSIGEAYLHAEDFEKAEEQFEKTLKLAYDGDVEEELIARIQEKLAEASELKKGGLDEIRVEIQNLFPDEEECIKQDDSVENTTAAAGAVIPNTCISMSVAGVGEVGPSEVSIQYDGSPFLSSKISELITESNVHSRSLASLTAPPTNENSSSSLFPKQSACSRGFNAVDSETVGKELVDAPVNVSSVVRKVRVAKKQPHSNNRLGGLEQQKKKLRTES